MAERRFSLENSNRNWKDADRNWEEVSSESQSKYAYNPELDDPSKSSNPIIRGLDYINQSPIGSLKKGFEEGKTLSQKSNITGEKKEEIKHTIPHLAGYALGSMGPQSLPLLGIKTGQGIRNIFRAGTQGAIQAHGDEANPALGAGIAGTLQAILGRAGKLGAAIGNPENVRRFSDNRTVKAAFGHNIAGLRQAAGTTARGRDVEDIAENIGRNAKNMRDEGIVKAWDKTQDIAPKLNASADKFGSQIGETNKLIDEVSPRSFNASLVGKDIIKFLKSVPTNEGNRGWKFSLLKEAMRMERYGWIDMKKAQKIKDAVEYKPTHQGAFTSNKDATNFLRSSITKQMDNTIRNFERANKTKGLLKGMQKARSNYATFRPAANIAGERYVRDISNNMISPGALYSGGVGATAGATIGGALGGPIGATMGLPIGGIVAGGANKYLREHGSSAAAILADKWHHILQSSPKFAKEFGNIMIQALRRGPAALTATHYLLMKNPSYAAYFDAQSPESESGRDEEPSFPTSARMQ